MFFTKIVTFVLFYFSVTTATTVNQCKKGELLPLNVDIEDCVRPPCIVTKATTARMDVHFVGTRDNISKIKAVVQATAFGVTVPYELPAEIADVCSNLKYGASCPIDKDEDVIYEFAFPVENYYPEIGVKLQVSLVDEHKKPIACFWLNIKVRKGKRN